MKDKHFEGTVVDVRSRAEFMSGHVNGSVNIPLQELVENFDKISDMKKPLILCCASGNRSGQAEIYLRTRGIECSNGGSWMDVQYQLNKSLV